MTSITQARDISPEDLEEQFNLHLDDRSVFFSEWPTEATETLPFEKQQIESKRTQFDVISVLPQAIAYMLNAPDKSKPAYGLLVNGREFVFLKLSYQPEPVYVHSFALSIERNEKLLQVLAILEHLRQDVLETN